MIQARHATGAAFTRPSAIRPWFPFLLCLSLLLALSPARAETPDDKYLGIMGLVDRADALREKGESDTAKAKYLEAQTALQSFKKNYPSWNSKVVSFRLNYVVEKLTAMSQTNAPAVESPAPPKEKAQSRPAVSTTRSPVKLLTAGAEPHKMLRILAKAGDKQSLNLTMKTAVEMGPTGNMKLPSIKVPMDLTVKDVSAEGDITFETAFGEAVIGEDAGANPMVAEAMKKNMGKGETITTTMSNRGVAKTGGAKAAAGADPAARQATEQMQDSLAAMAIQLPEEAVGPGAKWEAKQTIKSQGMSLNQTITYQLVSVEGDRISLKTTIAQSAPSQKIENPAMPGIKMDLTKFTGGGSGTITYDLAQVRPSQATADSHTEVSMAINMGNQKQAMNMKMEAKATLESK